MVWFKVDDRFHGSDPVKMLPRESRLAAVGLWSLTGAWSAQFLKDGFVPTHIMEDFGGTQELAGMLVKVGLWKRTRKGFQFTNWNDWQPTRDKVEQKRSATNSRVTAYRAKIAENKGDGNALVTALHSTRNAPPDPTRPDPTNTRLNQSSNVLNSPSPEIDLDRVKVAVSKHCGRECTSPDAYRIIGTVMERSKVKPKNPTAYVVRAIALDPFTWQQMIDEATA
jgi:hypothetical protein